MARAGAADASRHPSASRKGSRARMTDLQAATGWSLRGRRAGCAHPHRTATAEWHAAFALRPPPATRYTARLPAHPERAGRRDSRHALRACRVHRGAPAPRKDSHVNARPARFLQGTEAPEDSRNPLAAYLTELAARPENRGALAHWHVLPARPARFGELSVPLAAPLREALEARGIERLYTHQVQAIEALQARLDTVVGTGTASGKSPGFP